VISSNMQNSFSHRINSQSRKDYSLKLHSYLGSKVRSRIPRVE
jgi:hypothetical protein